MLAQRHRRRKVQVACHHDLLVAGLQSVLAPGWTVEQVELPEEIGAAVLLVDVDDPGFAGLLEVPTSGSTVAWTWRNVTATPPALRVSGWLRKSADAAATVAAFDRFGPPAPRDDRDLLSARELEVLQGLVDGLSNAEMADHLLLSRNTIKTHVRSVYRKTGSGHRAEAVAWGMLRGMRPAA